MRAFFIDSLKGGYKIVLQASTSSQLGGPRPFVGLGTVRVAFPAGMKAEMLAWSAHYTFFSQVPPATPTNP